MSVKITELPLDQLRQEAQPLFEAHCAELTVGGVALNIAWEVFEALGDGLHVVAAYDGDALVGYSVSIFVPRHLHYDFAFVQNDVLFVLESHRGGSIGGRLMAATRAFAKAAGAAQVFWHAKRGTALHEQLEKSDRFTCRDIIYSEKV